MTSLFLTYLIFSHSFLKHSLLVLFCPHFNSSISISVSRDFTISIKCRSIQKLKKYLEIEVRDGRDEVTERKVGFLKKNRDSVAYHNQKVLRPALLRIITPFHHTSHFSRETHTYHRHTDTQFNLI